MATATPVEIGLAAPGGGAGLVLARLGDEPLPEGKAKFQTFPSVVSHKFLVLQSSPCASMPGVVPQAIAGYWQGPQRSSGVQGELPEGAPHGSCGGVAPLGNDPPFPAGTRLATEPVGHAEALETYGTRH